MQILLINRGDQAANTLLLICNNKVICEDKNPRLLMQEI